MSKKVVKKEEKLKASEKVNNFIGKNKIAVISLFSVLIIGLIGYIVFDIINQRNKDKDLAEIEYISFVLTKDSNSLSKEELKARSDKAITDLTPYLNKSGIVGIRANMLAAELAYDKEDYKGALEYWTNVSVKNKTAYTYSYAKYRQGVCYEKLNDSSKAADCYKESMESKSNLLIPHSMFSYARILETQQNYQAAYDVYKDLFTKYTNVSTNLSPMFSDSTMTDDWANAAKSRMIRLELDGKVKVQEESSTEKSE